MIRATNSRLFRQVDISDKSTSRIYLHSMPGLDEPMETFREEMWRCGITRIICLAPLSDIEDYSWSYAQAIKKNADTWKYDLFEIPDFGIPEDRELYLTFILKIADRILHPSLIKPDVGDDKSRMDSQKLPDIMNLNGKQEHILIHCMAGVGRSGTFAVSLLIALGYPSEEAFKRVKKIGSGPENQKQKDLIEWFAHEMHARSLIRNDS